MVGYGTPWSGTAPCGGYGYPPAGKGQGDTEHTQAKNWLSRDSTSVLPSPLLGGEGDQRRVGGSSASGG